MILTRKCPLCRANASETAFPYSIYFNKQIFRYLRCSDCHTVFVDPVPDDSCFDLMYAKVNYHDSHYAISDLTLYRDSAELLRQYVERGSSVLDYGCGVGQFLVAAKNLDLIPYGVEFEASVVAAAAETAGCPVLAVQDFDGGFGARRFDVIHLGDVLEHLPDPISVVDQLLLRLKPGGFLFVEGPLEINPSPVYWASKLFGAINHYFRPLAIGPGVPTHLFRTSATAQSRFFREQFPALSCLVWRVCESGWPYAQGNWLKRRIADVAIYLGGKRVSGVVFGNRFQALYQYLP